MPVESQNIALPVVDGLELDAACREVLRPGELITGADGAERMLPRWFYRIDSPEVAETRLAPHFFVREFLETDFREAGLLRQYPKYLPMAVTLTATALELFRRKVGTFVRIAANGGYRSPLHGLNGPLSPHCWGTAVNIYKIGNRLMDSPANIDRYSAIIRDLLPGVWVRPHGNTRGTTFDQLHIDLGFTTVAPRKMQTT